VVTPGILRSVAIRYCTDPLTGRPPTVAGVGETIEPKYGERYLDALRMAAELHRTQSRKGTGVPYVSHLLHVSALVWEGGGDEDTAIAALLHDAVEDQGRGGCTATEIRERFGDRVRRIVDECSDAEGDAGDGTKPPWVDRKQRYLDRLGEHGGDTLLVVLADKLHNTVSMLEDLEGQSVDQLWGRFNAEPEGSVWYLESVHRVVAARSIGGPLLDRFDRVLTELAERLGADRATARPVAKPGR